jgi:hypothetical protein
MLLNSTRSITICLSDPEIYGLDKNLVYFKLFLYVAPYLQLQLGMHLNSTRSITICLSDPEIYGLNNNRVNF